LCARKKMTRHACISVQNLSALPRFVPRQAPPRSLISASRSRRARHVATVSCKLAPHTQDAGMGIRWRSVPPRRLAPPLSCPKQPFYHAILHVGGARSATRSSGARPPTPRWLESVFGGRACHLVGRPPHSDGQSSTLDLSLCQLVCDIGSSFVALLGRPRRDGFLDCFCQCCCVQHLSNA